ncbi:MAG TPA: Scr1 family TA system antitoxin-like transcriptional regulator [Streptosporangiaceae bacterium]|nr:Scr1 family TA system antitoxin-like transcriptional regulator [Streptosporangiaceae bacterium]
MRDFVDQLARLREDAGGPSLATLQRLSEQARARTGRGSRVLAVSTTHEILSHKRKRWPEWEWVASFVGACLAFAEEATGVDSTRLGGLTEWRFRFVAARNRHREHAGAGEPGAGDDRFADGDPTTGDRTTGEPGAGEPYDDPATPHADPWAPTQPLFEIAASLLPAGPAAPLGAGPRGGSGAAAPHLPGTGAIGAVAARSGELPDQPVPSTLRGGPQVVQKMLGTRLHRLREERCITHKDAGRAIRVSAAKISQMESGRVKFKEAEVAELLTLYGVTDQAERAALLSLVHQANTPGWWHTFDSILPDWFETFLGLEAAASRIRTYAVQFVPELLQTPAYARAAIRLGHPNAPEEEVERRVSLRMRRKELLTGPDPLRLWAVMDEMALLRQTGGVAVMRAQLRRLIEATALPNVTLNVLPLRVGGYAAVTGPFSILRFTEPELPDLIYLEQLTGAIYLDRRTDVDRYAMVMESLCANAAGPAASVRTLRTILDGQ